MVDGINGNSHIIKKGDNLTKIAKANNTTVEALLKLNPQIRHRNIIRIGDSLVVSTTKAFIQKEDYDSKKLNLGEITVNGKPIEGTFKSNYYANQTLDKLGNAGDKIIVSLQGGKEASKNDLNAFSILNKVVANHLNNNSKVIADGSGNKRIQTQKESVESTDLYKYMLKLNGDNFDDSGNMIGNNSGNNVQIPAVGKDANGKTYFTLVDGDTTLYFDSTGKVSEFKDGAIVSNQVDTKAKEPIIENNRDLPTESPEGNQEFNIPEKYDDKQLNLGTVFINGKPVKMNTNANFYRNEVNNFAQETMNDVGSSRLDVQLKAGNTTNPKYNDDSADSILKKFLGNNCDKLAIYQDKSNNEALALLRETDLYKALVSSEVNGDNFVNGKLKPSENGFNTVQLPSLETDANGTKYYILHTKDNILYFDDKGKSISVEY